MKTALSMHSTIVLRLKTIRPIPMVTVPVMLAMLFMLEIRHENKEAMPLLSCHDIVEILKVILPRANVTLDEITAQIEERHRRRQSSIDSAYRRQARMQQYSEH